MEYLQPILIMGAFFVIWYFLLIRPQKKKQNEVTLMRNAVDVGDNVTTIGGFVGRVVSARDDALVIECGPDRVKLKIARWGISDRQEPGSGE